MHDGIATTPAEFLEAYGDGSRFPAESRAVERAALLVSPVGFRFSEEAAADNRYMKSGQEIDPDRAHAQHRDLAAKLGELGVPVVLFAGRPGLDDAVFPNNVYATAERKLIIGSMRHRVRRGEAERSDVRAFFAEVLRYDLVDLSRASCVAELTGPLVIDRPRRIGFCGMTERVDQEGCRAMHEAFGLGATFRFDLVPEEYHTNLVLAVLAGRACVLHPPSFADPEVPEAISRVYRDRVLVLSDEEKAAFAGNCLAVADRDVLFSATSMRSLRPSSVAFLEKRGFCVHAAEVDEFEKGGGSLRCLIAEVF